MKGNLLYPALLLALVVGGALVLYPLLAGKTPPGGAVLTPSPRFPGEPGGDGAGSPSLPADAPRDPESPADLAPRPRAPDFGVEDALGGEVRLSSFLGRPVVMNFWATWCPYCRLHMPAFDKLHGEMGDTVQFLMIDLVDGRRETKAKGQEYILRQGYGFPVMFDTRGEAARRYGTDRGIPITVFVDAAGRVAAGAVGALDEEVLRRGIAMAMDVDVDGGEEGPEGADPAGD